MQTPAAAAPPAGQPVPFSGLGFFLDKAARRAACVGQVREQKPCVEAAAG